MEPATDGVSQLSMGLLLPDVVHRIYDEGRALRWDHAACCYEVIDGELFERRFHELRRKRDRDDGSTGRPFSRMHKYYKLQAGERWAKQGARFSPKDPLLLRRMQSLSHGMGGFMQEMARIPKSHALVFSPSKATTALTHENLQQAVPKLESYDSPGDMPTMGNVEQGGAFSSAVMRPDAENSMLVTELKGALEEHDAPPAAAVMDRLQMHEDAAPAIDPFQMQEHASQVMQQFQDNAQYAAAGVKRQRHATAAGSKAVDGRDVTVQLRNNGRMPHMGQTFEISLQEFLDTIDASSHYIAAKSPGYHQTAVPAQPLFSAVPRGGSEGEGRGFYSREEGGYPNKQSPDSIFSSTTSSDDLDSTEMSPVLSTVLDPFPSPHGVTSIWGEGGVWSQFSRGDQAYFFFRNAEHAPFSNGAVVALKGGQLVAADQALKAELYLVVSDKNALWKGEPHPTPEQEEEGHWCAFLGQVPLWVEGPVCAGQYLGPVGDGSGLAKVVRPGAQPAVAIALEDKAAGLTALKCMVSVGLNSLHVVSETGAAEQAEAASQRSQLLKRLDSASVSVQCVSAKAASAHKAAAEAKAAASAAAEAAHRAEVGVSQLTIQVHGLRESVRDNRQMLDDMHTQPISRRQYLWSCLCGLMSIKVTESWGPGIASQSFTVYTEEARPLSRMDEAKPLLPNPEASPAGPEEVEATCMGYQTSTSSSSCPISNLLSKLVCSTMKWSADAFVTDTTINLALTYVVAGHIALLYARGSDKRFAPFGYWYLVVLTLRLAYQVGVRQVAVRQVA